MKTKLSYAAWLTFLILFSVGHALSQPPTRIYGPVGVVESQTIYEQGTAYNSAFYNSTVYFGVNAGSQSVVRYFGFIRWAFTNSNLPPGSTITQVQFKFKAHPHGSIGPHSNFTLYDIKLPIAGTDNGVKYHAMDGTTNLVLDGQTQTVNGEEWFDETVTSGPLLDAIQSGLTSTRNYVTFGLKRNPEFGADTWWDMNTVFGGDQCSASLTVWFTPPQYGIQFKNDLGGVSYGAITATDHSGVPAQISSGGSLQLYWGDQTTVTATSARYQYGADNWKFQAWTDGNSSNNQNPKVFTILDQNPIVAYFEPVFDVTVRNDLEGVEAGQLTYQGNPVNTGYTEQDVFQNYSQSFSAITPQTSGGFTFNFYKWSDDVSSLDRNVNVTSTTAYQARFKAHLGSSLISATGRNSQRKLVSDDGNWYYLAYESSGDVWMTSSSDAGSTWSLESLVSSGMGTSPSSAPSLAVSGGLVDYPEFGDLYVIYRTLQGPTVPYYDMFIRKRIAGSWSDATKINTPGDAVISTIDPHPVIGRHNTTRITAGDTPELLAVWEAGVYSHDYLKYSTSRFVGSSWEFWTAVANVPYTNSTHRNPSMSAALDVGDEHPLFLTYDDGDNIFLRRFGNSPVWTDPEAVPASVGPVSFASQVSADTRDAGNPTVHVVWEALGTMETGGDDGSDGVVVPPPQSVMYQGKIGATWTSAHQFISATGTSYYRPSIANTASGHLAMVWDIGPMTYKATHDGINWSVQAVSASGGYANLANSGTSGPTATTTYVSTLNSGPPYKLRMSPGTFSRSAEGGDTLSEIYSRQVVVSSEGLDREKTPDMDGSPDGRTSFLAVELQKPILKLSNGGIVKLEFIPVADTLQGFNESSAWSYLACLPVTLTGSIDSVILEGRVKGSVLGGLLEDQEISLSFDVVDARNGNVIRRLGPPHVFQRDTTQTIRIRSGLNALTGRQVYIRPSLVGVTRGRQDFNYTLVHVHTLLDDTTMSQPVARMMNVVSQSEIILPIVFALHQNYPNPFNPTTEIRFDLPDAGNVSLVVYDVLGREVAALATGYQEAGYHSATWNAGSVASGVYFARFNVTNAEGKVAYSKINKLVLMK